MCHLFANSFKKCHIIVPLDTYAMKLTEVNKGTNNAYFLNFRNQ